MARPLTAGMLCLAFLAANAVLCVILDLAAAKRIAGRTEVVMRMLGVDQCPGRVTNLAELECSTRQDERRNIALDCRGLVDRAAQYFSEIRLNITKCLEAISYNTCEYYKTMSYKTAVCTMVHAPGMLWTNISRNVVPPLRCPFAAGRYRMENGYFDLKNFPLVTYGLENNKYLVELQLFDERPAMHMCFRGAVDFVRMRVGAPK